MGILTPDPGLVFWTSFSFITLLIILKRYAWKPILRALKVREEYIEFSLKDAAQAKEELKQLSDTSKQMMETARLERENIIREARELKNDIVREAREAAQIEAERVMNQAREKIERERKMALADIKQQIGLMSLEIAGKIIKEELVTEEKQNAVISKHLENVQFN